MNSTTSGPISVLHYVVNKDLTSVWKYVFTLSCYPNCVVSVNILPYVLITYQVVPKRNTVMLVSYSYSYDRVIVEGLAYMLTNNFLAEAGLLG